MLLRQLRVPGLQLAACSLQLHVALRSLSEIIGGFPAHGSPTGNGYAGAAGSPVGAACTGTVGMAVFA